MHGRQPISETLARAGRAGAEGPVRIRDRSEWLGSGDFTTCETVRTDDLGMRRTEETRVRHRPRCKDNSTRSAYSSLLGHCGLGRTTHDAETQRYYLLSGQHPLPEC